MSCWDMDCSEPISSDDVRVVLRDDVAQFRRYQRLLLEGMLEDDPLMVRACVLVCARGSGLLTAAAGPLPEEAVPDTHAARLAQHQAAAVPQLQVRVLRAVPGGMALGLDVR